MTRRKNAARKRREREALGPKLVALGLLLVVVPFVLRRVVPGLAVGSLLSFGVLLLAAGCGALWWSSRDARAVPSEVVPEVPLERDSARPFTRPDAALPVDRKTIEHERSNERQKVEVTQPREAPKAWGPEVFEVIEWRRFEALVEALFAQAGFGTKSQSHGADEGIDIWLYSRNRPGHPVSLVQCKDWKGKRVGVDKIRELRGVMAAKSVTRGQFATTSTFTPDAELFAKDNGVNLLDVKGLLALISTRTADQQAELLAVATEGDYWKPTCVNCGIKLIERTARKGGKAFWGCPSYPKCRTTMQMG